MGQLDSSELGSLRHQWLLNEGRGGTAHDTAGSAHLDMTDEGVVWVELGGPFTFRHSKTFTVTGDEYSLSALHHIFGVADMNQDGLDDLFYHGSHTVFTPETDTALLILENLGEGVFRDASGDLVDGGLYRKVYPSGRKTIVADFNGDGFDDIFMGQSGEHGDYVGSEINGLLLSEGSQGKLFPREQTNLLSPPCTLTTPAFDGQKPCESDFAGTLYYPDPGKELVPVNINANHHGTTAADVDGDGDIDIFSGPFQPTALDPVKTQASMSAARRC